MVFDDAGTVVAEIGTTGDGPDQLRSPSGVAVLPDGRIVIADAGHRALKIFNLDGTLSLTIGGGGSGAGNFVELDDVAVDSRGVIWVSDAFQDWVQSFATDGSLRELVGTYGDDVGELKTAAGIAVAESYGSLVVASLNGSAAQVFQLGPPSPVDWPAAEAALSTDSLVFPVQEVATTSAALRVDLFNTGDAPLGVSGTEVTGPFAVSGECIVVDPGGGCSFDVAFRPPLAGYHAGELALHTSAGAQPLRIDLSGVGFLPARLVVDPPGLHFSPQGVGTTSDVQTVVLSNPGTETLNLGQITLDEPFGISSHCGWELAGGSACTLWVDFSPTVAGATAGALTIHSDAPDSTRVVPLTGHGEILELSPQPARVNFGYLKPGLISQTEQIQVVNTGTAKVVVEDVSLAGADPGEFEIVTDQCGGNPIDVGQSCWLQARFSPSAIGVRSARLLLPITGGLQFNVELVGGEISLFTDGFESGNTSAWPIGLPGKSLRVRPIAIDFGEVELGAASGMRIVTVTNSGQRAVWLGRLQVVGENAPDFVIDEDHCGSAWLEAGESCWFAVDMLTLMEGSLSALVEIPASTAEDGPPDPVHLEGTVWWP